MARREPKYKRITPLRALDLLVDSQNVSWNTDYRLERLQKALAEHVRASLVKVKR